MTQARARHRPPGLVPAHRPLRGPAALAPPDQGRARGARRRPVADRADRRPADRRHDGHRHRAQSVHGAAELQGARKPADRRAARAPARSARCGGKSSPSSRRDAEVAKLAQFRQAVVDRWDVFFVMGNPPDYEPAPEKSIAAIAARTGRPPDEVAYDYITRADGQYLYFPVVNYVTGDHEPIREMLNDPACLLGLSDGGAHCTSIVDAGVPTLHADPLGPRPQPRAEAAARAAGQAPDQRDRRFLRPRRPRPPRARAARRRQPDRLRRACRCRSPSWCTTCRPTAAASCSASTATRRRSSPACRSSSAASTPARCPAAGPRRPQRGDAAGGGVGAAHSPGRRSGSERSGLPEPISTDRGYGCRA